MSTFARASLIIPADADEVWKVLRDFSFPVRTIPSVTSLEIEGGRSGVEVGAIRKITWGPEQYTKDVLLVVDDVNRTSSWELIESKPAGETYAKLSTITVRRVTETKHSFVQWEASFSAGVDASLIRFQSKALAANLQEIRTSILGKKGKILMVLTNSDAELPSGKTGFYLPEAAHPYFQFRKAGYQVDFASPKGGRAPIDVGSIAAFAKDAQSAYFLRNLTDGSGMASTLAPAQVKLEQYSAIFYAGGHGPLYDLVECEEVAALAAKLYEAGGVVGAVCHGPAALLNIKLSDGSFLLKGKTVTSFSNEEEAAVKLTEHVPLALESEMVKRGAIFKAGPLFQANVITSERLVTGQNPASSTATGAAVVALLAK